MVFNHKSVFTSSINGVHGGGGEVRADAEVHDAAVVQTDVEGKPRDRILLGDRVVEVDRGGGDAAAVEEVVHDGDAAAAVVDGHGGGEVAAVHDDVLEVLEARNLEPGPQWSVVEVFCDRIEACLLRTVPLYGICNPLLTALIYKPKSRSREQTKCQLGVSTIKTL